MKRYFNRTAIVAGIAIFSMFFGAGNTVFPLLLGQTSGDNLWYAFLGLTITAIGGPVIGLTGSLLYHGRCREFFFNAGPILGSIFLGSCLALLGPFAVLPRCVIVAYAALSELTTSINSYLFTIVFCGLALYATLRERNLLSLLGYVLSPLLLICLLSIITIAIITGTTPPASPYMPSQAFFQGLEVGYDTLDMIAAIIFSSSIWMLLGTKMQEEGKTDYQEITYTAITAAFIGGILLGGIYVGLSMSTAYHAEALVGVEPEALLPTLATTMLGPWFGAVANLAVTLACFTTVVSLMCSIAAITQKEILNDRVSRTTLLVSMALITIGFASTSFKMIMSIIHPVISICYPAIIVLTIFNILNNIYGWKHQAKLVYAVTLGTIASVFWKR